MKNIEATIMNEEKQLPADELCQIDESVGAVPGMVQSSYIHISQVVPHGSMEEPTLLTLQCFPLAILLGNT